VDIGDRQTHGWTHPELSAYPSGRELLCGVYLYVAGTTRSQPHLSIQGFGLADSLGAIGLIYFSVSEGRESFEKAAELVD
jgi:hypothetical protein